MRRREAPPPVSGRAALAVALLAAATGAAAQQGSVVGTVHNLSVSGPGPVKAARETEVCKFCHVPHSAVVKQPLWGHRLSDAAYETPEVGRARGRTRFAPQPDGSSRLCLSCHDGTVALGDVAGGGRPVQIPMAGAQRLGPGSHGYLGTDLSGSHPISVEMPASSANDTDADMALRARGAASLDADVKLDATGKVQCTTCHDPHRDAFYRDGVVPRFWVKPTVDEVCLKCHELR